MKFTIKSLIILTAFAAVQAWVHSNTTAYACQEWIGLIFFLFLSFSIGSIVAAFMGPAKGGSLDTQNNSPYQFLSWAALIMFASTLVVVIRLMFFSGP